MSRRDLHEAHECTNHIEWTSKLVLIYVGVSHAPTSASRVANDHAAGADSFR